MLVTIDGARIEEIFGGLDVNLLKSTLTASQSIEDTTLYHRYWASSREERRHKLMPFFWNLVTEQGSIAGDAQVGSVVRLRNRHWFSYPGYAELLLGEPHDSEIKSNDRTRNPYPTVLEAIRERHHLQPSQVATFAGWDVFNEIAEHREGETFVNAGVEAMESHDPEVRTISALQAEVSTPWGITRFDAFTFRLAMKHLAAARPRVLYISFGETDDWAHDGRYDRVLEAYTRIDGHMKELWTWLQAQPDYRARTHLLITTDHGRGHSTNDWRNHGATVPGSDEVWMAWVSPRMTKRGVWHNHEPLSSSQVAATLAAWMDVDWNATHPNAGRPIQ